MCFACVSEIHKFNIVSVKCEHFPFRPTRCRSHLELAIVVRSFGPSVAARCGRSCRRGATAALAGAERRTRESKLQSCVGRLCDYGAVKALVCFCKTHRASGCHHPPPPTAMQQAAALGRCPRPLQSQRRTTVSRRPRPLPTAQNLLASEGVAGRRRRQRLCHKSALSRTQTPNDRLTKIQSFAHNHITQQHL